MRCAFSSGTREQAAYKSLPPRGEERPQGFQQLGLLVLCDGWRRTLISGLRPYDTGAGAGGVDEHAVEKIAVPEGTGIGGIAGRDLGLQPEPFQGARYVYQSAGLFVHRHEAGRGRDLEEMRRLAAGCRAASRM